VKESNQGKRKWEERKRTSSTHLGNKCPKILGTKPSNGELTW